MLHAGKRAIETELRVRVLQIRQRELDYYTQNCNFINVQATLLFGFSFGGLISIPPDAHSKLRLVFLLCTTAAMNCELSAVVNTMLLSILGPGLALRGQDGSMHQAVDSMMLEYRRAYISFALGLVGCQISALLWGWMIFSTLVATAMTIPILVGLLVQWKYIVRMLARFQLPHAVVVSGRFSEGTDGSSASGDHEPAP